MSATRVVRFRGVVVEVRPAGGAAYIVAATMRRLTETVLKVNFNSTGATQ